MISNIAEIVSLPENDISGFPTALPSSSIRTMLHEIDIVQADSSCSSNIRDYKYTTDNFNSQRERSRHEKETIESIVKYKQKLREATIAQLENEIISIIQHDEFLDGEISQSERFIENALLNDQIEDLAEALMQVYLSNLSSPNILEGILVMISSVPYEAIEPSGQIMAMGLLSYKDLSVRDKAVQCFERWNSKKGLSILKSLDCHPKWLQHYVDEVIMYIERGGID